jgi:hypothetical protein
MPNAGKPIWPGSSRPSPVPRGRGEPELLDGFEVALFDNETRVGEVEAGMDVSS